MKITKLFLLTVALLSGTSIFALDITVKNDTNMPLLVNQEALSDNLIFHGSNNQIPTGQSGTFTLIRVGNTHEQFPCDISYWAQLLENIFLWAANYDWQGYFDPGWKTAIRTGANEYYFDETLSDATVTVGNDGKVILDEASIQKSISQKQCVKDKWTYKREQKSRRRSPYMIKPFEEEILF